jgi:hypothetical protein
MRLRLGMIAAGAVAAVALTSVSAAANDAPTLDDIRASIQALDQLDRYAFRWDQSWPLDPDAPATTVGTVIREPGWAYRADTIHEGELADSLVTIGRDSWSSRRGSAYVTEGESYRRQGEISLPPFADVISTVGFAGPATVEDLGDETLDGRSVRHLRVTVVPEAPPASMDPLFPDMPEMPDLDFSLGGFVGTIDAWIVEPDGWLLRLEKDGQALPYVMDGSTVDPARPVHEAVAIERVGDPTLVVEPPAARPDGPSASPAGEVAAARMVREAYAGLREVRSYRAAFSDLLGPSILTVVNRPKPMLELRLTLGDLRLFVSGERWWTGNPELGYRESDDALLFGACESGACDFRTMSRLDDGALAAADTFRVVGDEVLDGVPVVHLQSEAGKVDPVFDAWIPGTWHLWVAKDSGLPVRQLFDGYGFKESVDIEGVNDPANRLRVPEG